MAYCSLAMAYYSLCLAAVRSCSCAVVYFKLGVALVCAVLPLCTHSLMSETQCILTWISVYISTQYNPRSLQRKAPWQSPPWVAGTGCWSGYSSCERAVLSSGEPVAPTLWSLALLKFLGGNCEQTSFPSPQPFCGFQTNDFWGTIVI